MKKLIALLTLLCLLLALPVWAETGENIDAESAVESAAEPVADSMEDPEYRWELALKAEELFTLVGGAVGETFTGAPGDALAWTALSAYACTFAQDAQVFTVSQMGELYDALFAEGSFEDLDPNGFGSCFTPDEEEYVFSMADGDPAVRVLVNDTDTYTEDALYCDLSLYGLGHSDYPMDFYGSVTAVLVPDENAPFGATLAGWQSIELPVFPEAESNARLGDQAGNDYYAANAIDGDLTTCWAYRISQSNDPALTLLADEPQQVRGLVFTPGYAKSQNVFENNHRVATLAVTLGGETFSYELPDPEAEYFDGTYVLSFDGVYTADAVKIEVLDVHKGGKYDDVCISELYLF